jgi:hypothetical protein
MRSTIITRALLEKLTPQQMRRGCGVSRYPAVRANGMPCRFSHLLMPPRCCRSVAR